MKKIVVTALASLFAFNFSFGKGEQQITAGELIGRPVEEDTEDYDDEDYNEEMSFSYWYVTSDKLNVRAKPNSNSKILTKLNKYSVVTNFDSENPQEWISYSYEDYSGIEPEWKQGWINTKYLKKLNNDHISPAELKSEWDLLSGDGAYSTLEIEIKGNKLEASYQITRPLPKEMGGGRMRNSYETIEGSYEDGCLIIETWDYEYPCVWYDAKAGLLVFNKLLWKRQ